VTGKYVFGHEYISIPDLESKMEKGQFDIAKDLNFSLQGLAFIMECIKFDEEKRLNWEEVASHEYLATESHDYVNLNCVDDVSTVKDSQDSGTASSSDSNMLNLDIYRT